VPATVPLVVKLKLLPEGALKPSKGVNAEEDALKLKALLCPWAVVLPAVYKLTAPVSVVFAPAMGAPMYRHAPLVIVSAADAENVQPLSVYAPRKAIVPEPLLSFKVVAGTLKTGLAVVQLGYEPVAAVRLITGSVPVALRAPEVLAIVMPSTGVLGATNGLPPGASCANAAGPKYSAKTRLAIILII